MFIMENSVFKMQCVAFVVRQSKELGYIMLYGQKYSEVYVNDVTLLKTLRNSYRMSTYTTTRFLSKMVCVPFIVY